MTGTSARETSRPAKRPRPSTIDHPTNHVAPPVLFRLPSISQGPHDDARLSGNVSLAHGAIAMGAVGSVAPSSASPAPTASTVLSSKGTSASDPAVTSQALAETKAAGRRLFHAVVLVLLLIALAIISVLAFRGAPAVKPEIAGSQSETKDHLELLSDLRVPDIAKPSAAFSNTSSASPQPSTAQHAEGGHTAETAPALPQLSLEKPKPAAAKSPNHGLTMDVADLAKKPSAHVQLGTPVPVQSDTSASLATSQPSSTQPINSNLPLSTPRYETVSTPSSAGSTTGSGSGSNSNSGDSPSLYDGARKPADSKSDSASELMLSGANSSSEMSLIPSDYSVSPSKTTTAQPVSGKPQLPTAPAMSTSTSTGAGNSTSAANDSHSLGVTVGAGMKEPEFPKANATATPDFDVAAISSKFLEYSRQKSTPPASKSAEVVNPYAPATPSTPATTVSATTNAGGTYPQSPASAGVPYGTTGSGLTPYVRNSPTAAVPSGLGNGTAASGPTYPAATQAPMTTMPNQSPATTAYPSLSMGAGYPQANAMNNSQAYTGGYSTGGYSTGGYEAAYNTPSSGGNGYAIPPRNTATSPAQQPANPYPATPNAGYSQSYGYAPSASSAVASTAGTNPYGTANYNSAGYKPAATSGNPYPGAQAPQGMIGQSGFATAPTGDLAAPVPVTGTVGFGTSNTR